MADNPNTPNIYKEHVYKGIRWPNIILDSSIDALQTFEVRPDDIWVVTYPKSGTHWATEVVALILVDGYPDKIDRFPFTGSVAMINMGQKFPETRAEEEKNPMDMTPFLKQVETAPSPRIIVSHLPLRLLPPNLENKAKVVYVARNPKGIVNSLYNMVGNSVFTNFITWEDMLTEFLKEDMTWGPWFDHVIGFWKVREEKNLLFVFYEEMKKDPLRHVRQIAELIGRPLSEEALHRVVEHSSFKNMKKTYDKEFESKDVSFAKGAGKFSFIGKGTVAQWKNRFTVAQNEAFDKWYAEKMAETDLKFNFE